MPSPWSGLPPQDRACRGQNAARFRNLGKFDEVFWRAVGVEIMDGHVCGACGLRHDVPRLGDRIITAGPADKHRGTQTPVLQRGLDLRDLVVRRRGKMAGARKCDDRAHKVDATVLGPDDPDAAPVVGEPGIVLDHVKQGPGTARQILLGGRAKVFICQRHDPCSFLKAQSLHIGGLWQSHGSPQAG